MEFRGFVCARVVQHANACTELWARRHFRGIPYGMENPNASEIHCISQSTVPSCLKLIANVQPIGKTYQSLAHMKVQKVYPL